jgi:hypothetical protein
MNSTGSNETRAQQLYDAITGRGGTITATPGGKVRVNNTQIGYEELMAVKEVESEIARIVLAPQLGLDIKSTVSIARDIESVCRKIDEWKLTCTKAKGYEWERSTWVTQYIRRDLDAAINDYVEGKIEVLALHAVFKRYAEAHKRSNWTTLDGRRVNTVTPQVQPDTEAFARMTRLLGITPDEYAKRHGYAEAAAAA